MSASYIVLFLVLLIAVYTDIRYSKIKNWLTFPAIAIGPLINFLQSGGSGALSSVEAIGIMILVSVFLVAFRLFGGGDIKLLVAVGSLAGMSVIWNILLLTALAGGLLAVIYLARYRKAVDVTRQLAQDTVTSLVLKTRPNIGCASGIKIPYSIAIAVGTFIAVLFPFSFV